VATSLTGDADKPKPAVTAAAKRWYNWNKAEHRQREQSKVLWYMNPPVTSTDVPVESTTTTPAPAVETAMNGRKEVSDVITIPQVMKSNDKQSSDDLNISVAPSFQLRSTAVYSPPHGDRVLPGRREPVNTDVSNFKYYHPDDRSKQPVRDACFANFRTRSCRGNHRHDHGIEENFSFLFDRPVSTPKQLCTE
jgi:hypothetical protein